MFNHGRGRARVENRHNGADHSGCRQLHERVVRSTEVFENLIFLIERETDNEKLAVYLEFAKRELVKLRTSTHNFRVFIGERRQA